MKDFLKIFFIVCLVVGAFFTGRNFGESTKPESEKTESPQDSVCQSSEEYKNLKDRFQNLLDSADLKKADEVLGQVMSILLADLNLQISDEKMKDLQEGKLICARNQADANRQNKDALKPEIKDLVETPKILPSKNILPNENKFKSNEWVLLNSEDDSQTASALEKLQVKSLTPLLEKARHSTIEQTKSIAGTYQGTIYAVNKQAYGTLKMNVYIREDEKAPIHGFIKIFRDGTESISKSFDALTLGYSPEDFSAQLIEIGSTSYIQIYKLINQPKIAGIMYERLPAGTTKTIGTFILVNTSF